MGMNYLGTSVIRSGIIYQHQNAMFKLCFVILLSLIFIFVVSPKIKLSSGISLIASIVTVTFGTLSFIYCLYIPQSGDVFDVWQHETVELYWFTYVDVFSGLLDFTYSITLVSVFFILRCWAKILLNLRGTRNFMAAYFLVFISVVVVNFQYQIFNGVASLEARAIKNAEIYVKKYDATEEMTKKYVEENVNSWSAYYFRAQFLWDTEREAEALEYYKKAYSLLGEEDFEIKKYIEERIKGKAK